MTDIKKELVIGEKHNRLTKSEEIEILKLKNGTRSGTEGVILTGLTHSLTGGIGKSLWDNVNMDWIFIRDRILTYFVNLFEWEGKDVTPNFKRKMEKVLFRHGKVAIVKLPDGEFVATEFVHEDHDRNFYGEPTRIQIVTTNEFSGTNYEEGEFVIIYNNTSRYGTLNFANERMRQIVRALRDVDNASVLSRPKWGINTSDDDAAIVDAENAMNSDRWLVPMGNINFQEMDIHPLNGEDLTETKINTYSFQLSNLLKMLGLQVNDGNIKAERQTELEIARNDEFDSLLIKDMFDRRKEKLEELKEFGLDITLAEPEVLKENKDKEQVNGKLNQAIEKGVNNKEVENEEE